MSHRFPQTCGGHTWTACLKHLGTADNMAECSGMDGTTTDGIKVTGNLFVFHLVTALWEQDGLGGHTSDMKSRDKVAIG